jgi:26S proteasome regulatory subunit N12
MEGSYNKVFLSKGNVPAKYYTFFIDILLDTIREEIGACIEKAYDKISIQEAARLLFFENIKQLTDFADRRQWDLRNNQLLEFSRVKNVSQSTNKIPAEQLAEQAIDYAIELEMIV